jgi:hypothetical protein
VIGCPQRGGSVMARQRFEREHGSLRWRTHLPAEDWPLYVALLPAVLTAAVIGTAVAIAACSASSWPDHMPSHLAGATTPGVDDDYVEGLVKRGLAEFPDMRGSRAWTGGCALTQVR